MSIGPGVVTTTSIRAPGEAVPLFTWDPAKAALNLAKHGVAFEDAALVWSDPLHLVRFDQIEAGEER